MISITDKKSCCGCGACHVICPQGAIFIKTDEEGFWYPEVDRQKCIGCDLCMKVCPMLNVTFARLPLAVCAAKNPNESIRMQSSSGGVFSMLAEHIIDDGGVVYGAKWNENWEVVHGIARTKDEIAALRGSKYVQSWIGDAFFETKELLTQGKKVLFSGTPCQIAGLKLFLRKEYDNLITVDFICHGVPSPGVLRWHLQEELSYYERKTRGKTFHAKPLFSIPNGEIKPPEGYEIQDIRFRDKREGWKRFGFSLILAKRTNIRETISLYKCHDRYLFLKGMNAYLRPSCYECKHRSLRSGSDITIADYWGIKTLYPSFDDDKGVSAVLINTEKGKLLSRVLKDFSIPTSYADILNRNSTLEHSVKLNSEKRFNIFNRNIDLSFSERVRFITRESLFRKLIRFPKAYVKHLLPRRFFL